MSFLDGEGRPVDVEFQVVRSDSENAHTVNIIRDDKGYRANSANWNLTPDSGYNTDGVIAHEVGHLLGLPDEYYDGERTNYNRNFGDDDSIMNSSYNPDSQSKSEHAQGFMALVAGITGEPSIADRIAADLLGFESELGIRFDEGDDGVYSPNELAVALNISVEEAQILTLKYGNGQPLDATALKEMAEDGTIFYTNNDINAPIGVDLENVSFSYAETLDLLGENDTSKFNDGGVKADLEYILEYTMQGGVSLDTDEYGLTTLTVNDVHFFGDAEAIASQLIEFESGLDVYFYEGGDGLFSPDELAFALGISYEEAQVLTLKYGNGKALNKDAIKAMVEDGTISYTDNDANVGIDVDLTRVTFSHLEVLSLVRKKDKTKFDESGINVDLEYIIQQAPEGTVSITTDDNGFTTLSVNDPDFYGNDDDIDLGDIIGDINIGDILGGVDIGGINKEDLLGKIRTGETLDKQEAEIINQLLRP